MRLRTLAAGLAELPEGTGETAISGMSADSRAIKSGFLFAALPGSKADGASFVPAALRAGAAAILAASGAALSDTAGVPVLRVAEPRRALALMAARFYAGQPETIVAVTGTNGKTSVASFVRQIWSGLGERAASLGTIGLIRPSGEVVDTLTTPEPVTLHALLAELALDNVTHLSMEASSHGLEQNRLDGVKLAAGAFTNIGHDHLDYHKDVEDYFSQKKRLFAAVLPDGAAAVINADAERADEVVEVAYARGLKVMTVGFLGRAIKILRLTPDGFGQHLVVRHDGEEFEINLPLIGSYQASNAVVAAGLCLAAGSTPDGVFARLERLEGVPGRLEIVGRHRGGSVVVDYAHKPEALTAAIAALRPFVTGRLITVFGCGGDRDRLKRPMMGKIAKDGSDVVIVTDDNPRTEDPASIRAAILAASPGAREIGDRRAAIREAIGMMGKGDVVLIAGKGHETGQYIMGKVLPFSDREEAIAAIASYDNGTSNG